MLNVISGLLTSGAAVDLGQFESIQTVTVGAGGTPSVTFSVIPSTYKHLQIRYIVRSTQAATETGINMRVNGDSSASYAYHYIFGDGSSAAAGGTGSQTSINLINVAGGSATANTFAAGVLDILDYANSNKYKTIRLLQGWDGNGSGRLSFSSGLWGSATALNALELYPSSGNWAQYSSFALYGIKG